VEVEHPPAAPVVAAETFSFDGGALLPKGTTILHTVRKGLLVDTAAEGL
jgi:hypothetical protein